MKIKIFFLLIIIFCIIFIFLHSKKEKNINVVVITIDTLRADRLGCYGYKKAQTPTIDNLAKTGSMFTKFYVQTPLTLPSHTSLFTGTFPTYHKIRDNKFTLSNKIPTMASILQKYGYKTCAVVSASTLSRDRGLDQGFSEYNDVPSMKEQNLLYIPERIAEDSVNIAMDYLENFKSTPNTPFFMWLHLFDPHAEYNPPSPFKENFANDLYDGEIAYVDFCLKKFLDKLQKLHKDTLIIFTADHGEGLGEHGEASHGYYIFNSTLHVPLIFNMPDVIPKNLKIETPIRSTDIMPTVLSLLNIENHGHSQGIDFSNIFNKNTSEKDIPIYSETYYSYYTFGWDILKSITIGDYKYIDTKKGLLYNIKEDYGEKTNLLKDDNYLSISKKMKKELENFIKKTESRENFSDLGTEGINSLGYFSYPSLLEIEGKNENNVHTLPDPMEMSEILNMFIKAQSLMRINKHSEALEIFFYILKKDPNNIATLALVGKTYSILNNLDESLKYYEKLLKLRPDIVTIKEAIIDIQIQKKEYEKAKKNIEYLLSKNFESAIIYSRLAYIELEHNNYKEAEKNARKATILNSNLPSSWFYLGLALEKQEKFEQAVKTFQEILHEKTLIIEVSYHYAYNLYKSGEKAKALKIIEGSLKVMPQQNPFFEKFKNLLNYYGTF